MNVIPLDRARARPRSRIGAPRPIEPPTALASPRHAASTVEADGSDEVDDRLRMRQNLAAFLVIVAIVAAGTWLMASLHYYSQLSACLEAGHRNCLPLQVKYMASPYWR